MNKYDVYVKSSGGEEELVRSVEARTVADASLLIETLWPCVIRGKSLMKYPGHRVSVDHLGTIDYSGGKINISAPDMV